jgi:hypothetical protein
LAVEYVDQELPISMTSDESNGHYKLSESVMFRIIDEEAVILDLDAGEYFGLNSVGTRIWQLLSENQAVPAICEAIVEEFEVSLDVVQQDVTSLIGDLCERGLLHPTSEAGVR